MRIIALEEHFVSPGFINGPGRFFREQVLSSGTLGQKILDQLTDRGLVDVGCVHSGRESKAR